MGSLQFDPDGPISGTISVNIGCPTCGAFDATLDVEMEVRVRPAHRRTGHELVIDFKPTRSGGSLAAGLPATVCCSCGGFNGEGLVLLRFGS